MTPEEMNELREYLFALDNAFNDAKTIDSAVHVFAELGKHIPEMMRLIRAQDAEITRLREQRDMAVEALNGIQFAIMNAIIQGDMIQQTLAAIEAGKE